MRRWWAGMATCAAAALALTGCGDRPADVDGDLTNNWATIRAPEAFVPLADVCHLRLHEAAVTNYRPIDCAQTHRAQTVHVGTFTGADASGPTPPNILWVVSEDNTANYVGAYGDPLARTPRLDALGA